MAYAIEKRKGDGKQNFSEAGINSKECSRLTLAPIHLATSTYRRLYKLTQLAIAGNIFHGNGPLHTKNMMTDSR